MENRRLVLATAILALGVIALGAYVRLSNAGLGCPDWPGCYGRPIPAGIDDGQAHTRAWLEMIHRYAAGLLVLLIVSLAWRHRGDRGARLWAAALVGLILLQALLGMWTVTLKLMPLVVMGHLLGGMAILGLLWFRRLGTPPSPVAVRLRPLVYAAFLALVTQIALGGWTSANYAAVACPDLLTCQGRWWPEADFALGFRLPEPVGASYEGGAHEGPARTAIHFAHRLGALATLLLVGTLSAALAFTHGSARRVGLTLGAALSVQILLGLTNVLLHFPIALAVGHTVGAALLLLALLGAWRATRSVRA